MLLRKAAKAKKKKKTETACRRGGLRGFGGRNVRPASVSGS
jgi:hypothetical protein